MKTGFMVHLTLEVLPEIMKENANNKETEGKITSYMIYSKYTRRKMQKLTQEIKGLFMDKLNLKDEEEFYKFLEKFAQCLAEILYKKNVNRIVFCKEKEK